METFQLIDVVPGIIIFKISGTEFCINVKDVQAIKRLWTLDFTSNLPDGTSYLKFYNINIPVIDISKHFGLMKKKLDDQKMTLIIKHHDEEGNLEKTFGIIVDEVKEVIGANKSQTNYFHKFKTSNSNPFLSGTLFLRDREILLPNFSKIASTLVTMERNVQ